MANYEKDVQGISQHVDVDGDGEICVYYPNGTWSGRDEDYVAFTIEELESILHQARTHHDAYQVYRDSGFEEGVYEKELQRGTL